MMNGDRAFLPPLLIFTALCGTAMAALMHSVGTACTTLHWGTLLYFMVLSGVLHAWQERALATTPGGFQRRFMAGLVIKMMSSLTVLTITVLLLPKDRILSFAVPFIVLYLAFLGFSTVRLTLRSRTLRTRA